MEKASTYPADMQYGVQMYYSTPEHFGGSIKFVCYLFLCL